ncbi:hypothetical protein, partial [Polycladomyces subterraneus]
RYFSFHVYFLGFSSVFWTTGFFVACHRAGTDLSHFSLSMIGGFSTCRSFFGEPGTLKAITQEGGIALRRSPKVGAVSEQGCQHLSADPINHPHPPTEASEVDRRSALLSLSSVLSRPHRCR